MTEEDVGSVGFADVDFSFRGEYRLRATAEFSLVFAARCVLRGEHFDLHYLRKDAGSARLPVCARLGLVIAKKLVHRAVQRNLLKRLAREVFRHARQGLPSYDLVLRLSKSPGGKLDERARALLRADVNQLLIRLPR